MTRPNPRIDFLHSLEHTLTRHSGARRLFRSPLGRSPFLGFLALLVGLGGTTPVSLAAAETLKPPPS